MAQKLALTLAVLAVSFIAINAAATTASPSSNYNVSPVAVVDNSTDTSFVNYTAAIFVPGLDNTTLFVYGVNQSDTTVSFVRRSINASTLATINGSDSKISTTLSSNSSYFPAAGVGYLAVGTVYNSTGNFPDVTLSYTAVNGSFNSVKLTSNTDENTTYYITSLWYESSYFYIAYVQYNYSTSPKLDQFAYIQAVKVTDGSKLFTAPVKVATLNETKGKSYVLAGPTNSTNSSTINVLYRTNIANATYYVTLTINGSTVSSPVTLFTDGNNITYQPAGTLGSFSNSGVFVRKMDASSSPAANSTYGFYNGNTTAVLVAGSSMSGYAAPYVNGMKFVDGYVLLEMYLPATGDGVAYYLDYYFANQTRNGSAQVSLGTYGMKLQTILDANGAVWGGYFTSEDWLMKAYIGKLIGQTNAASILSSFFAFIALMVAAIFAF